MPLFSVYLYSVFAVVAFLRCIIVMACPLHISCGLWPFPQEKPVSNQDFRPTLCYLKFAPAWLLHTSNPCLIYPPGDQYAIAFAGPRAARPGARQAPPRPPGRSAGGAAAFWGRGQRPRPQNAAAPRMSAPAFLRPQGNRRIADGCTPARGSRLPLGARRGGGGALRVLKSGSRRLCLRFPLQLVEKVQQKLGFFVYKR